MTMEKELPKTKQALGTFAVVLAAFALMSSLLWTSATYTGSAVTNFTLNAGYYGAIAIIIAFFSVILLFEIHR